jgi:SAM-dependent methyltransferase
MISKLANFLMDPRLREVNFLGLDRLVIHNEILWKKAMIRDVFQDFYQSCRKLENQFFKEAKGQKIEIGAGTSFFKKLYPDVISTDIEPAPSLDMVVDAQQMPFENNSVKVLYCINCFHHFPSPEKFFSEVMRVVPEGGGAIIIDPYFGPLSRFLYKRLFTCEGFETTSPNWEYLPDPKGDAKPNQALSYLVFYRDRKKFQALFPQLEIVETHISSNFARYLLSGGVNFRQLVPDWMSGVIRFVEKWSRPIHSLLGLHHVVVIRKKTSLNIKDGKKS